MWNQNELIWKCVQLKSCVYAVAICDDKNVFSSNVLNLSYTGWELLNSPNKKVN